MDSTKIMKIAEFIIGAFLEVWTCQNEYIMGNGREDMSFWSYNKPTRGTLHSIKILLVHVQKSVDLTCQTVENVRVKSCQGPGLQGLQRLGYRLLRQSLYPFLKLDFEYGNLQEYEMVVDIWVTYLTPWKKREEQFSETWYFLRLTVGVIMFEIILCTIPGFCMNF